MDRYSGAVVVSGVLAVLPAGFERLLGPPSSLRGGGIGDGCRRCEEDAGEGKLHFSFLSVSVVEGETGTESVVKGKRVGLGKVDEQEISGDEIGFFSLLLFPSCHLLLPG